MVYKEKSPLILIAILLAGLVIGGVLGDYLGGWNRELQFLQSGFKLGSENNNIFQIDLGILKMSFGFLLKVNVASALGIIAAIFVNKKTYDSIMLEIDFEPSNIVIHNFLPVNQAIIMNEKQLKEMKEYKPVMIW
jgi:hypothetical protein